MENLNYNYDSIMDQLNKVETDNKAHRDAIEQILYGLENEHRVHWIDDDLANMGLPSFRTITEYYHISLY